MLTIPPPTDADDIAMEEFARQTAPAASAFRGRWLIVGANVALIALIAIAVYVRRRRRNREAARQ
jgi:hypothetical protein